MKAAPVPLVAIVLAVGGLIVALLIGAVWLVLASIAGAASAAWRAWGPR